MRGLPLLLAAALATAQPSPARRDAALAEKGLTRAVAAGTISLDEAAGYRAALGRALALLGRLPPLRADELRGVLHDVAAQWRAYSRPRALVLFSTLAANEDYLARHRLPASGTDVLDADGVVYRYLPGHGFVFHPLAEFARLNSLVSAGQDDLAAQLAAALVARAVPVAGGIGWEYEFPFSSGRPPWTSGMAQAVAAQALARAGDRLSDPALLEAADAAYRTVPRLLVQLPAGPWIKLYGWSEVPVLNAQLQAAVSVDDYAAITGDPDAGTLAGRLEAAAQALLPRFDTGYWSLYSLRGDEAPLSYHDYVIALLRRLAARTGEQLWRDSADRFEAYETEPPVLRPGAAAAPIYPDPEDGYKDAAQLRFWLSKLSRVTLRVGKTVETLTLGHGFQVIRWAPGPVSPGLYHPRLTAVDQTGRRATSALEAVHVRHDVTAPELEVAVTSPSTVRWQAHDPGTPWLRLAVRLAQGGERRLLPLGRRRLAGAVHLALPPGRWHATLVASNSAGRTRLVSLGYLPR